MKSLYERERLPPRALVNHGPHERVDAVRCADDALLRREAQRLSLINQPERADTLNDIAESLE